MLHLLHQVILLGMDSIDSEFYLEKRFGALSARSTSCSALLELCDALRFHQTHRHTHRIHDVRYFLRCGRSLALLRALLRYRARHALRPGVEICSVFGCHQASFSQIMVYISICRLRFAQHLYRCFGHCCGSLQLSLGGNTIAHIVSTVIRGSLYFTKKE